MDVIDIMCSAIMFCCGLADLLIVTRGEVTPLTLPSAIILSAMLVTALIGVDVLVYLLT
jgi:hypothetical protein